jgi:hypothetical protein
MKFYFDTNCARRIGQLSLNEKQNVLTSQLAIFETVSGITSEKEFEKRKTILRKVLLSNVTIIWESPKTLLQRGLGIDVDYSDVEATKAIAEAILEIGTYEDLLSAEFSIAGKIYTLATLCKHDSDFCDATVSLTNNQLAGISREQRQTFRSDRADLEPNISEITAYSEMILRQFILSLLPPDTSVTSPIYIRMAESLSQSEELGDFILSTALRSFETVLRGNPLGRNDALDYGHLVYARKVDFFVSDDRLFKRLPHQLFATKFINFEEYRCVTHGEHDLKSESLLAPDTSVSSGYFKD